MDYLFIIGRLYTWCYTYYTLRGKIIVINQLPTLVCFVSDNTFIMSNFSSKRIFDTVPGFKDFKPKSS